MRRKTEAKHALRTGFRFRGAALLTIYIFAAVLSTRANEIEWIVSGTIDKIYLNQPGGGDYLNFTEGGRFDGIIRFADTPSHANYGLNTGEYYGALESITILAGHSGIFQDSEKGGRIYLGDAPGSHEEEFLTFESSPGAYKSIYVDFWSSLSSAALNVTQFPPPLPILADDQRAVVQMIWEGVYQIDGSITSVSSRIVAEKKAPPVPDRGRSLLLLASGLLPLLAVKRWKSSETFRNVRLCRD